MTQNFLRAALTLTAPAARRLGSLLAVGGQRREYALADLVEHPAILLGMRCCESDRHSLERLLETFVPRAAGGMLPMGSSDRGPVFFH
jgi:hypothetical protein